MDYQPVFDYIEAYWPQITRHNTADRATLIGLPYPYVVPSDGEMFQEMYYWDSYFIALGLTGTPRADLIRQMTDNMAYLLERFGVIPNGTRYYFLSRSQPPFFMRMVKLAHEAGLADEAWLRQMTVLAENEMHTVWYGTAQPHKRRVHRDLSRYYDINVLHDLASCESGWDHSTRCDDRWLDVLPVDLNAILYDYELLLAWVHTTLHTGQAAHWEARAEARRATMHDLHWDADARFYFDYDYVRGERQTGSPSLAGWYPLWAGLATPEQAAQMVETWLPVFEQPAGLVTSLVSREGRQWAYPNGWAPLQWIVTEGLERYGYLAQANRIRRAWNDNCAVVFAQTGVMWEKYNVVQPGQGAEGGLYGQVTGFSWTNGVFIDFARRLASAPGGAVTAG